jgi:hypothetical protein
MQRGITRREGDKQMGYYVVKFNTVISLAASEPHSSHEMVLYADSAEDAKVKAEEWLRSTDKNPMSLHSVVVSPLHNFCFTMVIFMTSLRERNTTCPQVQLKVSDQRNKVTVRKTKPRTIGEYLALPDADMTEYAAEHSAERLQRSDFLSSPRYRNRHRRAA